jgi:hypothetical protein
MCRADSADGTLRTLVLSVNDPVLPAVNFLLTFYAMLLSHCLTLLQVATFK